MNFLIQLVMLVVAVSAMPRTPLKNQPSIDNRNLLREYVAEQPSRIKRNLPNAILTVVTGAIGIIDSYNNDGAAKKAAVLLENVSDDWAHRGPRW